MIRSIAAWLFVATFFALLVVGSLNAGGGTASAPSSLSEQGRTYDGSMIQDGKSSQRVAIVPVSGVIVNGATDPSGNFVGGEDLQRVIRAITDSHDYKGIILEVNTPGGAVLASDEVAQEVKRAQKHGLKVVSWMRDTAASGGYYISAGADRIVAAPTTITGSIGVILEYFNVQGLTEKVGVEPVVIKSGALKDIGSPFDELTPDERELLQTIIDEAFAGFVNVVDEGRDDLDETEVRALADGRIYTGAQAVKNGLVDELGEREEAYDAMAELIDADKGSELEVVTFNRRFGFFDTIASAGSQLGSPSASQLLWLAGDELLHGSGAAGAAADAGSGTGAAARGELTQGGIPRIEYRAAL